MQFDLNKKKSSHKNECCSYKCLIKSGIVREKFLKTYLLKKCVDTSNLSLEDMEKLYSKFQSETTKKSTTKKHETIIKKYGNLNNLYSKSGKLARETFIKNTLINNNLVSKSDFDKLSKNKLNAIFYDFYYKDHSNKIINGRLRKHGNVENIKKVYRDAQIKTICSYFTIDLIKFKSLSDLEKNDLIKKYKKEIKFFNHDPIKWKKAHLLKIKSLSIEDNDINKINTLYSEYLSERCNSNILHYTNNGYKKSKKGWYFFVNKDIKYFYRSSWELKVLEELDNLILDGYVLDVKEPCRIKYFYENKFRYYYPDILYLNSLNEEIILEIKPKSLLNDAINIAKIKEAKKKYTNNFYILSEDEIFSDKIRDILILIKGKYV